MNKDFRKPKDSPKNSSPENNISSKPADSARFRSLIRASAIAIGADIFLISLKYTLAYITGNAVFSADSLHSGGDLAVTITVLISIVVNYYFNGKRWARYAEGVVAFFISIFLISGSIWFFLDILKNEPARFVLRPDIPLVIAYGGMSLACVVSFVMFRFKRKIGEKHNSIAFIAEGMHTHSDYFTSLGVLATLLLGYFGINIARPMTFIVALLIFKIGVNLFLEALNYIGITDKISILKKILKFLRIYDYAKAIYIKYSGMREKTENIFSRISIIDEGWIVANKKKIITSNLAVIFFLYLGTGLYIIQSHQTGMELLFGRVTELNKPGLHYHVPKPLGKVIAVDTEIIMRLESGYRTNPDFTGEEPVAYLWEYTHAEGRFTRVPQESLALTGDENLIDSNFLCYYRINDPVRFYFKIDNAHEILRSMFVHEIHAVLGQYHLDSLLTSGRGKIQNEVLDNMKLAIDKLPMGVEVLRVYMQEAHPPTMVVPEYRAVASSREKKDEIIHEANAFANNLLPRTRGMVEEMIQESTAYSVEKLQEAHGDAEQFALKQRNFYQNQLVHRKRLWWNSVEKALKDKEIYILPRSAKRRVYTASQKKETKATDSRVMKNLFD